MKEVLLGTDISAASGHRLDPDEIAKVGQVMYGVWFIDHF